MSGLSDDAFCLSMFRFLHDQGVNTLLSTCGNGVGLDINYEHPSKDQPQDPYVTFKFNNNGSLSRIWLNNVEQSPDKLVQICKLPGDTSTIDANEHAKKSSSKNTKYNRD